MAAVVGRAAVAIFGGGLGLDAALNQFGLDYAASDQGRIDLTRLALSTGIDSAGRGAGWGVPVGGARPAGEYHYRTLTNAHNAAAELFAELGVVGAGLLVALVVLVVVVAVRVLLRRGSAQLGGTVACAALVALLGVALASVLPGSFLNTTPGGRIRRHVGGIRAHPAPGGSHPGWGRDPGMMGYAGGVGHALA